MKEGQGVAPASVPWGADDAARVPAHPPAHARRGPAHAAADADAAEPQVPARTAGAAAPHIPAHAAGQAEPHVRIDARKLESALLEVRGAVGRMQLLLDFPGIEAARAERQQLISQIDDYLLPRLRQSGAPILIAMVGSTGAGKSTLLNSIVGSQVSATGIRRPTTNSPGARLPSRRTPGGSPRMSSCPPCRECARRAWPGPAGTACSCWRPARACRAGSRCSTRRTSTPSSRRTGSSRASSSTPPTCGCS